MDPQDNAGKLAVLGERVRHTILRRKIRLLVDQRCADADAETRAVISEAAAQSLFDAIEVLCDRGVR